MQNTVFMGYSMGMSEPTEPSPKACFVCGDKTTRLRRGLCTRHYQQFIKKQASLHDERGEQAAETFENDCIWEGLLQPKRRGGRRYQDDQNPFEQIAKHALAGGLTDPLVDDSVLDWVTPRSSTRSPLVDPAMTRAITQWMDERTDDPKDASKTVAEFADAFRSILSDAAGGVAAKADDLTVAASPLGVAGDTWIDPPDANDPSGAAPRMRAVVLAGENLTRPTDVSLGHWLRCRNRWMMAWLQWSIDRRLEQFTLATALFESVRRRLSFGRTDLEFRAALASVLQDECLGADADEPSWTIFLALLFGGDALAQVAATLGTTPTTAKLLVSRTRVVLKTRFDSLPAKPILFDV